MSEWRNFKRGMVIGARWATLSSTEQSINVYTHKCVQKTIG